MSTVDPMWKSTVKTDFVESITARRYDKRRMIPELVTCRRCWWRCYARWVELQTAAGQSDEAESCTASLSAARHTLVNQWLSNARRGHKPEGTYHTYCRELTAVYWAKLNTLIGSVDFGSVVQYLEVQCSSSLQIIQATPQLWSAHFYTCLASVPFHAEEHFDSVMQDFYTQVKDNNLLNDPSTLSMTKTFLRHRSLNLIGRFKINKYVNQ